jgi:hypothetical protein
VRRFVLLLALVACDDVDRSVIPPGRGWWCREPDRHSGPICTRERDLCAGDTLTCNPRSVAVCTTYTTRDRLHYECKRDAEGCEDTRRFLFSKESGATHVRRCEPFD